MTTAVDRWDDPPRQLPLHDGNRRCAAPRVRRCDTRIPSVARCGEAGRASLPTPRGASTQGRAPCSVTPVSRPSRGVAKRAERPLPSVARCGEAGRAPPPVRREAWRSGASAPSRPSRGVAKRGERPLPSVARRGEAGRAPPPVRREVRRSGPSAPSRPSRGVAKRGERPLPSVARCGEAGRASPPVRREVCRSGPSAPSRPSRGVAKRGERPLPSVARCGEAGRAPPPVRREVCRSGPSAPSRPSRGVAKRAERPLPSATRDPAKPGSVYTEKVAVGQTTAAGVRPRVAGSARGRWLEGPAPGEESPNSIRTVRRVTPGRGNPTDQWHRKHTARLRPRLFQVSGYGGQAPRIVRAMLTRAIQELARRSPEPAGRRAEVGKGEKVR